MKWPDEGHRRCRVVAATLCLEEEPAPVSLRYLYVHPPARLCISEDEQQAPGRLRSHGLGGSGGTEGSTGKGGREKPLAGDAPHGRINTARQGARPSEPMGHYPCGWDVLGDRQGGPRAFSSPQPCHNPSQGNGGSSLQGLLPGSQLHRPISSPSISDCPPSQQREFGRYFCIDPTCCFHNGVVAR